MVETLPQEVQQKLAALGGADVVVGIPSFNSADTIGHVVRATQEGLHRFFPSAKCMIVNADGGSKDGTPERVLETVPEKASLVQLPYPVYPVNKLSTPYTGIPGKGSAVRMIFELARAAGAKACAIVESDVRSIQPEWVDWLVRPVLERNFDLVAPYYLRHKFDGTITNSIVYPATRALYGKRIRQPIGGEFGFSGQILDRFLAQNVWETEVAQYGIDIWLTTEALCSGARICQVSLGAKVHDPQDPVADLSSVLAQVVGAMLREMDRNAAIWQKIRGSEPVPVLGDAGEVATEPVKVDIAKMLDAFRIGHENLSDLWGAVLPPATLLELRKLLRRTAAEFRFPDEVWAKVIYDFGVAYHFRTIHRDHLLGALTPLYLGWVASFVLELETAGAREVEDRLEKLCLTYEAQKPYLISRWRWPDRFNP
jgi:hypothetical protein